MQYDSSDFDVAGLYAALDARRSLRGLSWQQVADEINSFFEKVPARPISRSTIVRTREGGIVEGDSVLQMLRWLGRTPESFMPQPLSWATAGSSLPSVGPDRILRFDAHAVYSAINAQRMERRLTWPQVASEIGGLSFSAASLKRLEKGGRVGFPSVMRIFRWLGRPATSFMRASEW